MSANTHIFSENMPWEAPFVKVGKGASSGDAVDGSGEETGQGRAGNLVGKVLLQSLPKVPVGKDQAWKACGEKGSKAETKN